MTWIDFEKEKPLPHHLCLFHGRDNYELGQINDKNQMLFKDGYFTNDGWEFPMDYHEIEFFAYVTKPIHGTL